MHHHAIFHQHHRSQQNGRYELHLRARRTFCLPSPYRRRRIQNLTKLCGLEASDLAAALERYLPREHDVPDTGNRSTLRFRFYTNTMDTLDESPRGISKRRIKYPIKHFWRSFGNLTEINHSLKSVSTENQISAMMRSTRRCGSCR